MKKLYSIFSLLALLSVTLLSCNEDIELVGDYKKTAVIYGLLDKADSTHFIKITRAFIGPGDANQIAQIPDSNYFESVTGTVTEYYIGGGKLRTFPLSDTIVTNKDQNGVFYAPEQKLYYFNTPTNAPLRGDCEYVLDLDFNNGAFQVTGRTFIVADLAQTTISGNTQPFRFVNNNNEFISTNIPISRLPSIGGITVTDEMAAHVVNTTLDVEFTEWEGTTPTVRHASWSLGEFETVKGENLTFNAAGATFYNVVKDNCSSNSAITKRTINSITTIITGGSQDLVNYMQVNEPSSSLAQTKPTFTNLTATDGQSVVGIFSSTQTLSVYKPFIDPANSIIRCINKKTTEYLCVGAIMSGMLFCSDHPQDIASGESWVCI